MKYNQVPIPKILCKIYTYLLFKRLTKSDNKIETVVMIKKCDLLDLCKSKAEQGLMKWLTMTNGPHPLQQMISRLLNALASFHKGRRYLADSPFLLRLIVTQLISSQHFWDTITCNMLLGTLQKLSMGSVIYSYDLLSDDFIFKFKKKCLQTKPIHIFKKINIFYAH